MRIKKGVDVSIKVISVLEGSTGSREEPCSGCPTPMPRDEPGLCSNPREHLEVENESQCLVDGRHLLQGGKAEAPSDPDHRDHAELITTSEGGVVEAGDTTFQLDVAPQPEVG